MKSYQKMATNKSKLGRMYDVAMVTAGAGAAEVGYQIANLRTEDFNLKWLLGGLVLSAASICYRRYRRSRVSSTINESNLELELKKYLEEK